MAYSLYFTCIQAAVQRDRFESMRDLCVAEIYGHGDIFLSVMLWVCLYLRLNITLQKRDK